jgi:hypothetical protein
MPVGAFGKLSDDGDGTDLFFSLPFFDDIFTQRQTWHANPGKNQRTDYQFIGRLYVRCIR